MGAEGLETMTTAAASPACIVCGGAESAGLYEGLLRCRSCGYVFADVRLSDAEFHDLYKKGYFFGEEYQDYLKDKETLQKNFRLRLDELAPFLDPARHKRLFEIGCAYGFFLDAARPRFESVSGMDVAEDGVAHARALGLDAACGDFLTRDFGSQRFDVVTMWDTIEHLKSPHLFLEKAASLLDKGGLIAITTGDIDSLNARVQKDKWRLIHPPTHAHYFSPRTLTKLLDRLGFEVISDGHCGFYRSVDNAAYNIFTLRQKRPWIYNLIAKSGLGRLDFYLNLYDIMYVIARKK